MTIRVDIVPHTHWDREWYAPFQTFRLRLVDLLDELLPALEADEAFSHFLLDGQMAVVDDYLAVRPEAEERLRRLATSGRVAMGPWYALPDEFLVSGETLVRNLQLGIARAARFGGAMAVGYLPDMFGHIAQMPQLLRAFGFEHAVVWRGVPAAIDRTGFWWRSPDGSEVRAEYLPQGYGNGALVPRDGAALLRRIGEFVEEQGERLVGPVLWMNGTDHLAPQPWLPLVVDQANHLRDGAELHITSLAAHLAAAPTDGLPRWQGELRSSARANLLMGVASNRVDVKVVAAVTERTMQCLAEPLSALLLPPEQWPGALLDAAWLEIVRNSAHDSICACSHDEVVDAVLHRYAEATRIAQGLAQRAIDVHGLATGGDGPVVLNPSARTRSGLVEVSLPGDEVPAGCQLVRARPPERELLRADAAIATVTVAELEYVRSITSFRLLAAEGDDVLLAVQRQPDGTLVTPAIRRRLAELRDQRAGETVRVVVTSPPRVRVLGRAADVPGYGWRGWSPGALHVEPVRVDDRVMTNGAVRVDVDQHDGSFAVDGLVGLGRLVDDGDEGDTYNWCPPETDLLVDRPTVVAIEAVEAGPLRGRLVVRRGYDVPAGIVDHRRAGATRLDVATTLELHAGDDLVRITIELDNHGARDHRLRMHLPLLRPAGCSEAECAFAVVERGLVAEGGPTELGVPTFPSRRFVRAGGLTVVHEGLLEYELVDVGDDGLARTLALTLVRATGLLSQGPMATRPLPAGPITPLEGAQLQRPLRLRLALHIGSRDPYALVDDAFLPLQVTTAGGGHGARSGQALAVEGAEVSAVRREGGALQVRVFNPSAAPTTVRIPRRRGRLVDLRGGPVGSFAESFDLAPWQIATAELDEQPPARQ